jgi:hypothetical protein
LRMSTLDSLGVSLRCDMTASSAGINRLYTR